MAIFNPGVQSNDPNYLNYPRVIDAPEPDLSKAIGIKTATEALQGTAKFTDEAIREGIKDKAYALIIPRRRSLLQG